MKVIIPVSILDRLLTQHLSLATITVHLRDEHFIYKPNPEKWSIRENIAHLAKYQKLFIERLDKILATDIPKFEAYKAENDLQFEEWKLKDTHTLLNEINTDRRILIGRFENLTENDLKRAGLHSNFGKLNVLDWTEFFLLHEAHHFFTIFKLAR